MNFVAMRMLTGDRAKYFGLVFAVAFSAFLISHQASIFCGLMSRVTSQIRDVADARIWVMDPETQYVDEVKPLSDNALTAVRSVPGVQWAVRLSRTLPTAKAASGRFRTVICLGVDDASLVGVPRRMALGSIEDLRQPDSVLIDRAGFLDLFPGEPLRTGDVLEFNDRRARIVGIVDASAPFQTFPVVYARYSVARGFAGPERRQMSLVLAEPEPGLPVADVTSAIARVTGLKALDWSGFSWATIRYYLTHTGIPVNFGITVAVALLVGLAVAGQTFYLFTLENLKQFAALKAVGVTDGRLVGMIGLQALVVGAIGFSIGFAACALFFVLTKDIVHLRGFILLWQVAALTGAIVLLIVLVASLASIRRVLVLEPAMVFRG